MHVEQSPSTQFLSMSTTLTKIDRNKSIILSSFPVTGVICSQISSQSLWEKISSSPSKIKERVIKIIKLWKDQMCMQEIAQLQTCADASKGVVSIHKQVKGHLVKRVKILKSLINTRMLNKQ